MGSTPRREEGVKATVKERGLTAAFVDGFKGTAISDKTGKLDVEAVQDDHYEITEEESFIQNALNGLDQRHAAEMEILQRRMEELQRHCMKENLGVDLVSTSFGQQQVQQHQQNSQQLQSTGQREAQQQQIPQQQLLQQLNSLIISPPPGHTSRNGQGGAPTTSPLQVPQPVSARHAYMATGTQPQFVTINGQQLQVVCGLQGQQILAVQDGPGQPQQYFSLPPDQIQQLSVPGPQWFVPGRFPPRSVEQEGSKSPFGSTRFYRSAGKIYFPA